MIVLGRRRFTRHLTLQTNIVFVKPASPTSILLFLLMGSVSAETESVAPIVDMHVHAFSDSITGENRTGTCAPYLSYLSPHDVRQQFPEFWGQFFSEPPCPDPAWLASLAEGPRLDPYCALANERGEIRPDL